MLLNIIMCGNKLPKIQSNYVRDIQLFALPQFNAKYSSLVLMGDMKTNDDSTIDYLCFHGNVNVVGNP